MRLGSDCPSVLSLEIGNTFGKLFLVLSIKAFKLFLPLT